MGGAFWLCMQLIVVRAILGGCSMEAIAGHVGIGAWLGGL